jgi:hypothetical protein
VPDVVVTQDEFLWFVDESLRQMVAIIGDLGDDLANTAPELPGANSPFAILTHCLGVMEFWGGAMVAGRAVERDRDAEFTAAGDVAGLAARTERARQQLRADLAGVEPRARPHLDLGPEDQHVPFAHSQAAVLLHIYEELQQHLGQMELTRDLLR